MYYVYLLESRDRDEIYVGSTNDLRRRLKEHNDGKEISTKRYLSWLLVSYEAYQSEKDARHREKMLKQHGNAMRQFKIKSQNSFFKRVVSPSTIFFREKNSAGFTLVETIIYVAIIGGIIATFISFSLNISNARNKTYVQEETQANARVVLNIITQKIQSASGVNTSASVFGVDPGVLSLAMSSSTLNPTIINLSADNGRLQIKEGDNATTTITTAQVQVNNLVFNNFSASSTRENIGVDLNVSFVSSTDINFQSSQTLHTAVSVRE
ncbi:MAG: GIY-YIG nuclease family protein [Candidatus Magasanikiibacteriota bacterium]